MKKGGGRTGGLYNPEPRCSRSTHNLSHIIVSRAIIEARGPYQLNRSHAAIIPAARIYKHVEKERSRTRAARRGNVSLDVSSLSHSRPRDYILSPTGLRDFRPPSASCALLDMPADDYSNNSLSPINLSAAVSIAL